MSDQEPSSIYAEGPSSTTGDPAVERRTFRNNDEAFDAKQAESLAAQNAPNPTTDPDLAREAYGEDWNRRRGHGMIGETEGGDKLYDHGGSAVDAAGHVLGHTSDVAGALGAKRELGTDGELGRYPVTAEGQAKELREANEDGTSAADSKTLGGGLGSAVDAGAQAEHDRQVAGAGSAENYSAPADAKLTTGGKAKGKS